MRFSSFQDLLLTLVVGRHEWSVPSTGRFTLSKIAPGCWVGSKVMIMVFYNHELQSELMSTNTISAARMIIIVFVFIRAVNKYYSCLRWNRPKKEQIVLTLDKDKSRSFYLL
jgi:hypothetical protein